MVVFRSGAVVNFGQDKARLEAERIARFTGISTLKG